MVVFGVGEKFEQQQTSAHHGTAPTSHQSSDIPYETDDVLEMALRMASEVPSESANFLGNYILLGISTENQLLATIFSSN